MKTIVLILKEHYEWRHQIFKLAKADIIKTYSGAALGWAWAIVKPAITIGVFLFAFTVGIRNGHQIAGDYPYVLWLMAGIVPWFYMSDMLTGGAGAIRKYKYLVTKLKYPVSTIPTFIALAKLVVHLVLLAIIIVLFCIKGVFPNIYYLQIPIYMLLMVFFFICWAMFSAMLSAVSSDFLNLVKSLTTAFFWMSGIMWDSRSLPYEWLKTIFLFNPITFCAEGYRNSFLYEVWIWEEPIKLAGFGTMLLIIFTLAIWSYKKLIKEIPDVL